MFYYMMAAKMTICRSVPPLCESWKDNSQTGCRVQKAEKSIIMHV